MGTAFYRSSEYGKVSSGAAGFSAQPHECHHCCQQGESTPAETCSLPLLLGLPEQNMQQLCSQRQHPQQVRPSENENACA